jgi:D-hydroxyproline dehydrogenase subunit beta
LAQHADVLIVGGGIAGCSLAFELARRDIRTTLIEERSIAWGASGRNNGGLMNTIDPAAIESMRHSRAVYTELNAGRVSFGLRRTPKVVIARNADQLRSARSTGAQLRMHGEPVEDIDADWVARELGFLEIHCHGGILLSDVWAVNAKEATYAFADAALMRGATIECGVRVGAVETRGGKVVGLATDRGFIAGGTVVVANGPWAAKLVPGLQIMPGRGWLLQTAPLRTKLTSTIMELGWPGLDELAVRARPPTVAEVAAGTAEEPVAESVLLTPLADGSLTIGATLSRSLLSENEGDGMPMRVARRAVEMAPGLRDVPVLASWSGIRPMTPDGQPVVGAIAGAKGLYVNGGHGSLGMLLGPATSAWLADALSSGRANENLRAFRPDRFQRAA